MTLNVMRFISGEEINFRVLIKDKNQNPIDPNTVRFIFKKPDGTKITFTSPDVVKIGTGDYEMNYAPIDKGYWRFRSEGDSPVVTAGEMSFIVETQF